LKRFGGPLGQYEKAKLAGREQTRQKQRNSKDKVWDHRPPRPINQQIDFFRDVQGGGGSRHKKKNKKNGRRRGRNKKARKEQGKNFRIHNHE